MNCAALTETVFESEFFGHVKGAFTGADQNKIGLAEAAHGGDLFLDEIEALPLSQQAKLLRFLESGEIRKVGAKDFSQVQVRIIAASNQPLQNMVLHKQFREDLYFRLAGQKIILPPLRDRSDDVSLIAQAFLDMEKPRRNKSFTPEALQILKDYSWPGNVRELKRLCEQMSLTSPLPLIREEDIVHFIKPQTLNTGGAVYPDMNLESFICEQEKAFISHNLNKTKNLDVSCQQLQISKSKSV